MGIEFRIATEGDVVPLAELYADSVSTAGPQFYTPAQVDSWASSVANIDRFREFILKPTTYVATDESGPIGFCGIEQDGHVASVYLRGDRQREGIGTRLIKVVLDHAAQSQIERLYAEASEFSLPLFLKMGFLSVGTETVEHNGSTFVRHLVEWQAT